MESEWTWEVWGPPITVFVAALALGWISIVRMRPRSDASIERESRRIDLESARDEAIAALKQLELDKDKLPADEYARERERLLRRGARALEVLDNPEALPAKTGRAAVEEYMPPPAQPAQPTGPLAGLAPEWRGALYALGSVVLLMILWNFAGTIAKPKDGGMGGGSQASQAANDRAAQVRESPIFKKEVADQEALLKNNPNDLGALNQLTYLWLMMADDPQTAFGYNETALRADPKNPDARAYRAVLTTMMGMADRAIEMLDELLAEQPTFEKAVIYRAMILIQMGRRDEGMSALQAAAQANPTSQELQLALQAAQRIPSEPGGMAPGGAPPPPGGTGEPLASGTITIDPAAQSSVTPGAVLYVSLSNPAGGPPIAAQRYPSGSFPLSFNLTTSEIRAMGAGDVPPVFDVKARIDFDGNAMTKEPGPAAVLTGVQRGASGLALNLTLDGAPVPAGTAPAPAPGGGLLSPLPAGGSTAPLGPAEVLVSGTASLDAESAGLLTGTETVFVSIRDPAGGPPLAAAKLGAKFPLEFSVTTANIVAMGGARPIPDTFNVTVRIDRDGNAMTKEAGPEALAQGVKKGTSALQLKLE